jgi:hypothetical protein
MSVCALSALILITGCPGSVEKLAAPEITGVVADSHSVALTWQVDTTIENNTAFSGYNIYATTDSASLMALEGDSLNKDNTTIVTTNTYTVNNLGQDSVYYFQVRTVNTDDKVGEYNTNVPLVSMAPRPEYINTVYLEWYNGDTTNCALHLSTGDVKKRSDISTTWGDIWIDHNTYGPVDSVWFQSAYKADTTAGYRDTRLQNLGQYTLNDVWKMPDPTLRVEPIKQGDLVCVKTKEGNYAKIHVDSLYLDTVNLIGWAKITYAYQKIVNFPHLGIRK